MTNPASGERDVAPSEVNAHNLSTEEIQAKKTINARTWRKRVSQHRELMSLLP
jgi:hypothetical protein